jgi:SPP1 family predicted phage head-tail adaptor
MTARELREWVAVFLPELTSDGQGGARETIPAGLVYDRPAGVREMTGSEGPANDQTSQRVTYEITIRYDVAITTAHRVWWRGMYLDIGDVRNVDMRDTWLTLNCTQREAGAA